MAENAIPTDKLELLAGQLILRFQGEAWESVKKLDRTKYRSPTGWRDLLEHLDAGFNWQPETFLDDGMGSYFRMPPMSEKGSITQFTTRYRTRVS